MERDVCAISAEETLTNPAGDFAVWTEGPVSGLRASLYETGLSAYDEEGGDLNQLITTSFELNPTQRPFWAFEF